MITSGINQVCILDVRRHSLVYVWSKVPCFEWKEFTAPEAKAVLRRLTFEPDSIGRSLLRVSGDCHMFLVG